MADIEPMRRALERWDKVLDRIKYGFADCWSEVEAARLIRLIPAPQTARIPQVFSTDLQPLEDSESDALLSLSARAEQVCLNRFTFFKQTEIFGERIPWRTAGHRHWRAELHAFDFALDLGLASRVFGSTRAALRLRYLVADWIASNPAFYGEGWNLLAVSRRLRNWILAADLCRQSWTEDTQFFVLAFQSIALQALYLCRHGNRFRTNSERLTGAVALLLVSRCFPEPWSAQLRSAAAKLVPVTSEPGSRPTFVEPNPDPSQSLIDLRALLELLLFAGSSPPVPESILRRLIESVTQSLEEVLLPGGHLPRFGAGRSLSADFYDDSFALAAVVLESGWCKALSAGLGVFPYFVVGEPGKRRFYSLPSSLKKPTDVCRTNGSYPRLTGSEDSAVVVAAELRLGRQRPETFLSYELVIRGRPVVVDSSTESFDHKSGSGSSIAWKHNNLLLDDRPARPWLDGNRRTRVEFSQGHGSKGLLIRDCRFRKATYDRFWFAMADGSWLICDKLAGGSAGVLTSTICFYPAFKVTKAEQAIALTSPSLSLWVIAVGPCPSRVATAPSNGGRSAAGPSARPKIADSHPYVRFEWKFEGGTWLGGYWITAAGGLDSQPPQITLERGNLLLNAKGRSFYLPLESG